MDNNPFITPPPAPVPTQPAEETPMYGSTASGAAAAPPAAEPSPDSAFLAHTRSSFWD